MRKTASILFALLSLSMISCVKEDDTSLPPYTPLIYLEDFETAEDNTLLDIPGFINQPGTGSIFWTEQTFDGNGYTELLSETDSEIVSWLITPPIDLGNQERTLHFQSAQHHMPEEGSKLEVFIATNFNGDINIANWTPLKAKTPTIYTDWYKFISSGELLLAGYSGTIYIAFRATHSTKGSGYYIDNIKLY